MIAASLFLQVVAGCSKTSTKTRKARTQMRRPDVRNVHAVVRQITYSSHPNHRARMVHAQGERQFRTYDTSQIRPEEEQSPMASSRLRLGGSCRRSLPPFVLNITKGCSKPVLRERSRLSPPMCR